ncbi:hypothetical protein SAMN05444166_5844 [Singulisphaera sp. GP187]|nr:hypothetical protein SAMN05444166_5844 [Singulisphaera sp. GP187]
MRNEEIEARGLEQADLRPAPIRATRGRWTEEQEDARRFGVMVSSISGNWAGKGFASFTARDFAGFVDRELPDGLVSPLAIVSGSPRPRPERSSRIAR